MSVSGTTVVVTVVTVAMAVFVLLPTLNSSRLTVVEELIIRGYSTPSISSDELQSLLKKPAAPLLFDVRTAEEYAVSHLPTAINISPTLTATDFLQRYSQKTEGQRLVFYCSVGQRSSALANRVRDLGEEHGSPEIVNLRGGIFRWATDGLPMENEQGKTSAVHPYNQLAAKLLPPAVRKTNAPDS